MSAQRIIDGHTSNIWYSRGEVYRSDFLKAQKELIALRMDKELGALLGNENYDRISRTYMKFMFRIVSEILALQFFHPDNLKLCKLRVKEAKEFLNLDSFKSVIYGIEYRELSKPARFKKNTIPVRMG